MTDTNETVSPLMVKVPPGRTPMLGRIVHYTLTQEDASRINMERDADRSRSGNYVSAGDHVPAMVTRTWFLPHEYKAGTSSVNLKCMLDGNDDHWVSSKVEGTEPGTWHWPELV